MKKVRRTNVDVVDSRIGMRVEKRVSKGREKKNRR